MTQLGLLDEWLQAEQAQAPHWRQPRSKIRTSARPVVVDYRAWLEHVEGCESCAGARADLAALRDGSLEWELRPPCPVGLRLLPLTDVDAAAAAIDRETNALMVRALIDHARRLDAWGPEARMSLGQAWEGATRGD